MAKKIALSKMNHMVSILQSKIQNFFIDWFQGMKQ